MPITLKVGDTRFGLIVELENENGPVDLSGCRVRFYGEDRLTGATVIDKIVSLLPVNLKLGKGIVAFTSNDLNTARQIEAEIIVTYPDGGIETFPNNGRINYEIVHNLRE